LDAGERTDGGLTRCRLIQRSAVVGVGAWTAPAILDRLVSPAGALTLPPCVPSFSSGSSEWSVDGVAYPGCGSYSYHRDLQLNFTVATCTDAVTVKVKPMDTTDGPDFTDKGRWCWTGSTSAIQAEITHVFAANLPTTTWTTPFVGSTEGGCTHTAYPSVDDGIHVNLCTTNEVRFTYQIGTGAVITKYVTVAPNGTITVS